ncbi:MAG: AMP-dependent synthetase [Rhodospirillales bacterium]|nr:AMP-dependent synthetase [Rhodospirillales bacterium]
MNSPYGNYAYAMLTANALRTPDKVALVCRGRSHTFDELNREVNRLANGLVAAGIAPGQRIGSLLSDSLTIARLYPAEAKIGAVIAAFNPFWPQEQIVATCKLSGLDAFVFDEANAAMAAKIRPQLPRIKHWFSIGSREDNGVMALDPFVAEASDAEPILAGFNDDPLAFFYTSGTTGVSKAVVHSHASTKAISDFLLELPHDESHVWGTGPIIWGVGYPCTMGAALYVGMTVALQDDFGPRPFLAAVQREKISHVTMLPSQWADLLANHPHEDFDLSSLKVILLGAEPIGSALRAKIRKRLPQVGLYAFYGQTESPYTCITRLSDTPEKPEGVGRPRAGAAVKILDPLGNCVVGAVGDLAIAGPHRMVEYLGLPEKNAEVLKDGWFFSGDLAILDASGRVHVLGRKEDAIAKAGRYIRPLEIEDVVMTIPGVGEAGVVGAPDGAVEQKIILAVSAEGGAAISEESLRSILAERLPASHQPDLIVLSEALPHTQDASGARGKLLRRVIRDQYQHLLGA